MTSIEEEFKKIEEAANEIGLEIESMWSNVEGLVKYGYVTFVDNSLMCFLENRIIIGDPWKYHVRSSYDDVDKVSNPNATFYNNVNKSAILAMICYIKNYQQYVNKK